MFLSPEAQGRAWEEQGVGCLWGAPPGGGVLKGELLGSRVLLSLSLTCPLVVFPAGGSPENHALLVW